MYSPAIRPHLRVSKRPDGYYRDLGGILWHKFSTAHPVVCDYAPCGQLCDHGFIMLYEPKQKLCADHFQVHLSDGRKA